MSRNTAQHKSSRGFLNYSAMSNSASNSNSNTIPNPQDITTSHRHARRYRAPGPSSAHANHNAVNTMAFAPVAAHATSTNHRQTGSGVLVSDSQAESLFDLAQTGRAGSVHDNGNISTIGQGYATTTRHSTYMGAAEAEEDGPFITNFSSRRLSGQHSTRPSQEATFLAMATNGGHAPPPSASQDNGHPPSRHSDGSLPLGRSHQSPTRLADSFGSTSASVAASTSGHPPSNSAAARRLSVPTHTPGLSPPQAGTGGGSAYTWNADPQDESDMSSLREQSLGMRVSRDLSFAEAGRGFNSLGDLNLFPVASPSAQQHTGQSFGSPSSPYLAAHAAFAPIPRPSLNLTNGWPPSSSRGPRAKPAPSESNWRNPAPPPPPPPPSQQLPQPPYPQFQNYLPPAMYAFNTYSASTRSPSFLPPAPWNPQVPTPGPIPSPQQSVSESCSARLKAFKRHKRTGQAGRWTLKDVYGHVVEFCGDQQGSRFLQDHLDKANSDEKERVFNELERELEPMSMDIYGNYVIQKLLEHGSQAQKRAMVNVFKPSMKKLCMNKYACRVVQKALESVLVGQRIELTKALEPDVMDLLRDESGNHVLQVVIQSVPREHLDFIPRAFRGRVRELATDQFACRVIQRLLEHGTDGDKAAIVAELHEAAPLLVTGEFSNYVIQHIVTKGLPADQERMIASVLSRVVALSKNKFSSNVVEKCVVHAAPEVRLQAAQKLIGHGSEGANPVTAMYKDNFGNYVLQTFLKELTDGPQLDGLVAALRAIPEVKNHIDEKLDPQSKARTKAAGRVLDAIARARGGSKKASRVQVASSLQPTMTGPPAPPVPSAAVNTNTSASPTPVLTMEPNSPHSSDALSANGSATDVSMGHDKNGTLTPGSHAGPEVLEES